MTETKQQKHRKLRQMGNLLTEISKEQNKLEQKTFCPCCGREYE